MANPMRLFSSPITGEIFATKSFKKLPCGGVDVVGAKYNVTADVYAIVRDVVRNLKETGLVKVLNPEEVEAYFKSKEQS